MKITIKKLSLSFPSGTSNHSYRIYFFPNSSGEIIGNKMAEGEAARLDKIRVGNIKFPGSTIDVGQILDFLAYDLEWSLKLQFT